MNLRIFKSFSEYNAAQAACKFTDCKDPIIKLADEDYAYVLGNAAVGKLAMIQFSGTIEEIRDQLRLVRFKQGERMVLRICGCRDMTMQQANAVTELLSPLAYNVMVGVAGFDDIFPGEYMVDIIVKYEPQSGLRL